MTRVVIVSKYLPHYRLSVLNKLSLFKEIEFTIVASPISQKEGIKMLELDVAYKSPELGGIRWHFSKSLFYYKSLQIWQTNVLNKIINSKLDVIVLEGAVSHLSTWLFSILCYFFRKKVLFWSHGLKGNDKGLKKHFRVLFYKYLPHANLVYGEFQKNVMIKLGIPSEKIFVVGNSLNYKYQKQIKVQLTNNAELLKRNKLDLFQNDYPTLIFIGRLVDSKKVNMILYALEKLNKLDWKFNCIIIGSGNQAQNLQYLSLNLNLTSQVFFVGDLHEEEMIAKYFCLSDMMVSPGNVGLNCIHALTYGVPVLTHNNFYFQGPEVEAITAGKNGLFFENDNQEDLVNQIINWFSMDHRGLEGNCLSPIENKFNSDIHANRIVDAIRNIMLI